MTPLLAIVVATLASGADSANVCRFVSATPVDVLIFEDTAINDEGELVGSEHVGPDSPSLWIVAPAETVRIKYRLGKGSPWISLGRVSCTRGAALRIL